MLGTILLFVGIILIHNGLCTLYNVDPKSAAVFNIFLSGLLIITTTINLVQGNYYAAACGFMFGFTYLFIVALDLFNINPLPFAWFSTFVAINAIIFGTVEGFIGNEVLGIIPDWRWGVIWYLWALLWGTTFVTDILHINLGKFVPYLQIFEGIFTAWIPALMLLLYLW